LLLMRLLFKKVNDVELGNEQIASYLEELKLHEGIDTRGNWNRISKRIRRHSCRVKLVRSCRYAAAIVAVPLTIIATLLWAEHHNMSNEQNAQLQVTSAYGTVTKAVLSDGTEVWLNSGSTLRYPQRFGKERRNVALSGEAYFKVTSDRHNRFDVELSDGVVVSAWGTEFNVDSYSDDNVMDITLAEGNIDVSEGGKTLSITPGRQIVYDKENRSMTASEANLAVDTGWKEGMMIFRRAEMTEVAKRLARHFNVDIRLEATELYEYEYSATFTTETLNEILQLLEKTAPITYRIDEPKLSEDNKYTRKIVTIDLKH